MFAGDAVGFGGDMAVEATVAVAVAVFLGEQDAFHNLFVVGMV